VDVDPVPGPGPHLKPARHVLATEDGEAPIVGVGTGPELTRPRWPGRRRIVVEPHRPDGPIHLAIEEVLVHTQGDGRQSHGRDNEPVHRPVVGRGSQLEARRNRGPDVRQEMEAADRARVVRVVGHVHGPYVEELLEVGWGGRIVGGRQGLSAGRVVAAIGAAHRVARPELVRERQREELVGPPPEIVYEDVRHPVSREGEKADLLAGRVDLLSHVLTICPTTGAGDGEVDDRDLGHGRTPCASASAHRAPSLGTRTGSVNLNVDP
jgi:hypothetical protein